MKSEGDKVMRLLAQTPEIEAGNALLPKADRGRRTTCPRGSASRETKDDDQVDSTAHALKWMTDAARVPNVIQYYRKLWEENKGRAWEDR